MGFYLAFSSLIRTFELTLEGTFVRKSSNKIWLSPLLFVPLQTKHGGRARSIGILIN